MPQNETVPRQYVTQTTINSDQNSVRLQSSNAEGKAGFVFECIKTGIFRIEFTSKDHLLPPFPSVQRKPSQAFETRLTQDTENCCRLSNEGIEATVEWSNTPIVTLGFIGEVPLHVDLPYRSYVFDNAGCAHYSRYDRGSLYIGLGEKAAPLDLSNRSFSLSATDSFGYDVHRTDPLYKHIPLLIKATADGCVATFSSSHSRGSCSVGSEMDGMWGRYKVYRQDFGGLEEYLLIGRTLRDIVTLYADLVGYPQLVPRWAFGYLAGGMKYSMLDEPRACDALSEFASKLAKFDIPCSGFQMSSGYTVAETEPKNRHVFTWNLHRFPDPQAFVRKFRRQGIRLIANIKPYVLASHPDYQKLAEADAFFKDPRTGKPAIARLWSAGGGTSGEGGHLDFSSQAAYDWWVNGVRELRKIGIDCPWNDNNEYVIPSDDWQLKLDATAVQDSLSATSSTSQTASRNIGLWGRFIHTELMGKASHDALLSVAPHERPFVLTRCATAGTMKYCASSWSGDNVTSWEGMRGANALSLTAGMCLLQCYGHDIGGFEGPQPSPELLVRWVQLGIHSPRFAINCFKTLEDNNVGDVIEPWMYPEVLPQIRKAINRRYEIIPYLYSLHLQSHLFALPPQRWVGWGYEDDPEVWTDKLLKDGETQYWLGDTLMVGGVYEPDAHEADLYLPKGGAEDYGFLNTNAPWQYLSSGEWHTIATPWKESIPIFARIGGAVPIGRNVQTVAPGDTVNEAGLQQDDWRGVEIFPPLEEFSDGKQFSNTWYEDDGISPAPAKMAKFTIHYSATKRDISVKLDKQTEDFEPPWIKNGIDIILPVFENRSVVSIDNSCFIYSRRSQNDSRARFHLRLCPRHEQNIWPYEEAAQRSAVGHEADASIGICS